MTSGSPITLLSVRGSRFLGRVSAGDEPARPRQLGRVGLAERALLRAFMVRGAVDPRIAGPGSEASQAADIMDGPTFESDSGHSWEDLVSELIGASVAYLRHGGR
jgi:hypothetical protein